MARAPLLLVNPRWFLMFRLFPACFGLNGAARLDRTDSLPGQSADFFGLVKLWFASPHRSGYVILICKGGRMLRSIGLPELMVILVVAVLLFGGKKIPELAKGLGEGIRNFKESLKGETPTPPTDDKKQA
jgi:sec-independent protein translocase protein TatA